MLALALALGLVQPPLELLPGDRIVVVGSTFAERMDRFGHLEAMLTAARPRLGLTFRNLGWSADRLDLKPRPAAFGSEEEHLRAQHADVVVACYGSNEAFAGEGGLERFRERLAAWVTRTRAADHNHERQREVVVAGQRRFPGMPEARAGDRPVRVALVSPIAHEDLGGGLPDPGPRNEVLARATALMAEVARERGAAFVDVFTPTSRLMAELPARPLTINGIHLDARGDWLVSRLIVRGLGIELPAGPPPPGAEGAAAELLDAVREKAFLWFQRWRPVNAAYVYGGRKEPFGVHTFPPEMELLDGLIADAEARIATLAASLGGRWDLVPGAESAW